MKPDAVIVLGDDWEGLYLDGKLVEEGHSLDARMTLEAVGYDVKTMEADAEWLTDRGRLPDKLDEVVKA